MNLENDDQIEKIRIASNQIDPLHGTIYEKFKWDLEKFILKTNKTPADYEKIRNYFTALKKSDNVLYELKKDMDVLEILRIEHSEKIKKLWKTSATSFRLKRLFGAYMLSINPFYTSTATMPPFLNPAPSPVSPLLTLFGFFLGPILVSKLIKKMKGIND